MNKTLSCLLLVTLVMTQLMMVAESRPGHLTQKFYKDQESRQQELIERRRDKRNGFFNSSPRQMTPPGTLPMAVILASLAWMGSTRV